MVWNSEKSGTRGHPETFPDGAIQVCLTLEVLLGLPLRQTVGLVASLLELAGLTCAGPVDPLPTSDADRSGAPF